MSFAVFLDLFPVQVQAKGTESSSKSSKKNVSKQDSLVDEETLLDPSSLNSSDTSSGNPADGGSGLNSNSGSGKATDSPLENLSREELIALGLNLVNQNNPHRAIKIFNAVIEKNPKDYVAKGALAKAYVKLNKDKDAIFQLKEALEMNPQFENGYLAIAEIYQRRNNKYELRLLYVDMIEKIEEKPLYVMKLCEIATLDGVYDQASKYCNRGIAISPEESSNYIHLAITYKETGKNEEAQKLFKRTAEKFPDSEVAQLAFAKYLEDQKSYQSAFTYYSQAVQINPKSVKGYIGMGTTGAEIQKFQESLDAFSKSCKIDRSRTITIFRRVANQLRISKTFDWVSKYMQGIETCL